VTKALASATTSRGIFLIYISTDYVFSGRPGEAPYKTISTPDPPNVYGQTKLDGEKAVLDVTSQSTKNEKSDTGAPPVPAVILRVPILYGRADEPSESAVNTLVTQVWESQKIKSNEAKIKIDDYAQRFPTNTEDVARVCRDICKLYLDPQAADPELPQVLQFSSEDKMTKWDMCKIFSEILSLPIEGLVPFKPEETPKDSVKRPYDCHLDTSILKDLGIDVHTADFRTWWRRELGAFRH
jgi:dTDP-4-dehydrorhamnose reductase